MRNFRELLEAKWAENKFVCVGLDSDSSKMPKILHSSCNSLAGMFMTFNSEIVNATKDIVLAYKPNIAFYEAHGEDGWRALKWTVKRINEYAPDVPVILDAKRADIGNTNNGYVKMAFEDLKVDAITVHPYLGGPEALKPFLDREDKGIIVLCRTSNPGAKEFQDLAVSVDGKEGEELSQAGPGWSCNVVTGYSVPFFKHVAYKVSHDWNMKGNCSIVAGATYPEELADIRKIVGDMPILIPGIGAQGGDVEKTVKSGINSNRNGMIINSSRGIIFASSDKDYAEAARREAQKLHDQILEYLPEGKQ